MATVKVYYDEDDDEALPQLCVKCGAPATTTVKKSFGPRLWPAFLAIGRRRPTLHLPMCDQHRHHWIMRHTVKWGGTFLLAVGFGLGVLSMSNRQEIIGSLIFFASIGFGLVWSVVVAMLDHTTINTAQITSDYIVLVRVSDDFRDALLDDRADEEERYHERRSERCDDESRRDDFRAADR